MEKLSDQIGQLPPIYREVLDLHIQCGLSYEDVATELNITVSAMKSRLFRSRQILKEKLDPTFLELVSTRYGNRLANVTALKTSPKNEVNVTPEDANKIVVINMILKEENEISASLS